MTESLRIADTDVLLVVDVQNDFCRGGALEVPDGDAIVAPLNQVAKRFRHVVLTQDWHTPGHQSFASSHRGREPMETIEVDYGPQILWPDHCVQGTRGAGFHPDLDIPHAQLIVRKGYDREIDSYSAFFENDQSTPTGLAGYLRERRLKRCFLAGLAFDVCVRYSAEDARKVGLPAVVLEDLCRGIDMAGSVQATRDSFAEHGVALIASRQLA
ncbi:MAG TPA: bifunctional nicotinamidase/pyrazinamidase [Thermohalobaculum sp.]|nr:bifunctional nicotinamidase/pyrazinamidase [Thermohalobaculum sp.]